MLCSVFVNAIDNNANDDNEKFEGMHERATVTR